METDNYDKPSKIEIKSYLNALPLEQLEVLHRRQKPSPHPYRALEWCPPPDCNPALPSTISLRARMEIGP